MSSYIICGSKQYKYANLNKLVDSFDIIVRSNMLLPNTNYGKRKANYQVLNAHVEIHRGEDAPLEKWIETYAEEYGISENYIVDFYNYVKNEDIEFMHFGENNTPLMKEIFAKNDLPTVETTRVTCGLGAVAEFISNSSNKYSKNKLKPFLVGFSLRESEWETHQYNKTGLSHVRRCHSPIAEISMIKQLHQANLVDATFCAIEDSHEIKIDSSILTPTSESLDILKRIK